MLSQQYRTLGRALVDGLCRRAAVRQSLHTNSGAMNRLFEGEQHAETYAKFRPRYPVELQQRILDYIGDNHEPDVEPFSDLAIDVACGTGQSTLPLLPYFRRVIGVDVSAAQIEQARQTADAANVEYRVGSGEDLSFVGADSVDLITCAQGLHWLDLDKFYEEALRVLKPRGVLAAYGYGVARLNNKEATGRFHQYHFETLRTWWDKQRKHVDNMYKEISLPFDEATRDVSMVIEQRMTVDQFIGYLTSFSSYQTLLRAHPDTNVLTQLEHDLKRLYGHDAETADSKQISCVVTWPIFCLMGRK